MIRLAILGSGSGSNMQALLDFIETIDGGGDLLLDKARGVSHGGGVQLPGDSAEFAR